MKAGVETVSTNDSVIEIPLRAEQSSAGCRVHSVLLMLSERTWPRFDLMLG